MTLTLDNPSTIQCKYQKLSEAQKEWAHTELSKRLECIKQFSALLGKFREELARTLTMDMGKPIRQSRAEIDHARKRIQYFLEHSHQWLTPQIVHHEFGLEEVLSYEPLGVIGNISAWNYPYLVGVNVFVPALIAGNAVLYKPSEYATETGKKIEELILETDIPENIFSAVIGDGSAGQHLLTLPLDGYFFTGSYKTGSHIAKQVAHRLVPVGLELGGKDPLYVTDEINDLQRVAKACVEGCFYNNGQSCCAVERLYVHHEIYQPFLYAFLQETQKLKMGNPLLESTDQGPLTRAQQIDFLNDQIEDAIKKGAHILLGGTQEGCPEPFFSPTVIEHVDHSMKIMREESFGPIIGIQKVQNDAEALELMQDTDYGLTASIYCDDIPRAQNILEQLDIGNGMINCCDRVSPHLPWSGRNHSGLGSTLSYLGILAFVKPKGYQIKRNLDK